MNVREFTVVGLREMCKRGLVLRGNKIDLIKRLNESDASLWREEVRHLGTDDDEVVEGLGDKTIPRWPETDAQEDVQDSVRNDTHIPHGQNRNEVGAANTDNTDSTYP